MSPCRDLLFNVYFEGESGLLLHLRPLHPQPVPGAVQLLQVAGAHQFTAAAACQQACERHTNTISNNESLDRILFLLSRESRLATGGGVM